MLQPEAGDIVYGPYPITTSDRTRLNHYCLVLDTKGDKMLVAIGTSSHIDSCPLPTEVLISDPRELRQLRLRKPTRFDIAEHCWVSVLDFVEHSDIRKSPNIIWRLQKAFAAVDFSYQEDENE